MVESIVIDVHFDPLIILLNFSYLDSDEVISVETTWRKRRRRLLRVNLLVSSLHTRPIVPFSGMMMRKKKKSKTDVDDVAAGNVVGTKRNYEGMFLYSTIESKNPIWIGMLMVIEGEKMMMLRIPMVDPVRILFDSS